MGRRKTVLAAYEVASMTGKDEEYKVSFYDDDSEWCTCKAQRFRPERRPCKHIRSVMESGMRPVAVTPEKYQEMGQPHMVTTDRKVTTDGDDLMVRFLHVGKGHTVVFVPEDVPLDRFRGVE
jgi:hypothetical protein